MANVEICCDERAKPNSFRPEGFRDQRRGPHCDSLLDKDAGTMAMRSLVPGCPPLVSSSRFLRYRAMGAKRKYSLFRSSGVAGSARKKKEPKNALDDTTDGHLQKLNSFWNMARDARPIFAVPKHLANRVFDGEVGASRPVYSSFPKTMRGTHSKYAFQY